MKRNNFLVLLVVLFQIIVTSSCAQSETPNKISKPITQNKTINNKMKLETAVLGGGCFWCTEAQYLLLDGIQKVESGYAGGDTENPTYKEVCTGLTNHAEVIKITYDASVISYDEILYAFWQSHDPTTLNKQGADEGTQYRSAIFYADDIQKQIAQDYIKKLNAEKAFANPVVTTLEPLTKFYIAEDYHQNYYNNNKNQGYCMMVVGPKVDKFKKIFSNKLKK